MTCKYGDDACPCQDGDPCHYEGVDPMTPPATPWVVEACVKPGYRTLVWLGKAKGPKDAIARAHAAMTEQKNDFCAYMTMRNYVATGHSEPIVWEKEDGKFVTSSGVYF